VSAREAIQKGSKDAVGATPRGVRDDEDEAVD
jgi:hypothetical protein